MVLLNIHHPDIEKFIEVKKDLTKLTGANLSIDITDDFMEAVINDEDYELYFGDNDEYSSKVKARVLWDKIIDAAHSVAEPGIVFSDNHNNYAPDSVYKEYKGSVCNPCSEIWFQPYASCILGHMNLYNFVENPFTENAVFDGDKFYQYVYESIILMDILVDLEIEAIDRIIRHITVSQQFELEEFNLWNTIRRNVVNSRRIGLGIMGLADVLAALNIRYDSENGLMNAKAIMKIKMRAELDSTIDLSIRFGPFKGFDINLEQGGNSFYEFIESEYPEQWKRMSKFGRRHVSWSTIAPTGSKSLEHGVSSGMEPIYSMFSTRSVKVEDKTEDYDYIDKDGQKFKKYSTIHPRVYDYCKVKGIDTDDESITKLHKKELPWVEAEEIDWEFRIKMQSILQEFTSHSISSTINLPSDIPKEVVSRIYLDAWNYKLKGITVNI